MTWFTGIDNITISMETGWNWISSNVHPPNPNVEVIWEGIDCLEILKGYEGFYVPGVWNGIGDWDIKQMYSAYLSCDTSLIINGQGVDHALPIDLKVKWNWVSYLPIAPIDAVAALASITDYLDIAKAHYGFYVPDVWNGIGNMEAGQGYKLHTSQPCTLIYPSGGTLAKRQGLEDIAVNTSDTCKYFSDFKTTEDYQAVLIESVDGKGIELESGDELGVFTENGLCVGGVVLTDNYPVGLMAWMDDARTEIIDGFKPGEMMVIKIWDGSDNKEYHVKITPDYGSEFLGEVPITQVSLEIDLMASSAIPKKFALEQNYPNPFNPTTKIKFALPEEEEVKIKIYDIVGKVVKVLVDRYMKAGYHEIEFNAQNIASGVYFYRIEAGDFVDVKKMIFLK
jgi:hypothetical protein